jgi:hypothetical protein
MGKVWPLDGCAVSAHVDDGAQHDRVDRRVAAARRPDLHRDRRRLLQTTEDGGKTWRKVEDFPACRGTYVSDVFASPRD